MRIAFDRFVFDSDRRELHDGKRTVHLGPQAFRLLEILIANRPRPIRKEDLYEEIWRDTVVDESNLAGLVNELRAALGDRARKPRFIRTVHGFGYAFCFESEVALPAAAFVVFKNQELPLRAGSNVLGRDRSADLQIEDSTVSRKHASIDIAPGGATIEDLDSKNGTFIDGARLDARTPLRDGQSFVLGDAVVVFRKSRMAASTRTATRHARSRRPLPEE